MAIKGSLKEASLADVCQLLALGQKTGCLSVTDQTRFGQIFFERGRIIFSRVVNRRDRIGDLIVRDGAISTAQLHGALETQSRSPDRKLGQVLVEAGYITAADLQRYVRTQIEEAIYHLFTWSRGSFFFEIDVAPADADILVSVNPDTLLLEAARRVDEWSLIEKKIPSFDLIFEVDRPRVQDALGRLTAEQQRMLALLDGRHTVSDIMELTGLPEFDAGKALFGLIQAGFVTRVGKGEPNYSLALVALRERRYRDGMRHLKTLLDETGPAYGAFMNMSLALRCLHRPADALLVLNEAEKLRPGRSEIALARGAALLEAGELQAALGSLQEYVRRLGPQQQPSALYYYHAGLAEALARRLPEAGRLVEQGLERYPSSAPLLLLDGLIAERRCDYERAEQRFRQVQQEDPAIVQTHKNLGDVCYRRGNHDLALEHYERAVRLDPELGDDVYAKLGNIAYQKRGPDEAVRLWRRALELNPKNQLVRSNIEIAQAAG